MTTYDFKAFATAINDHFKLMANYNLYTTTASKDDLYDAYLQAYPDGTNPIYVNRTEYDCSTCKEFIRNIGGAVAIVDGAIVPVWDVPGLEYPYNVVAETMSAYVTSHPISSVFCLKELSYGAPHSKQLLQGGDIRTWYHFYARVDAKYHSNTPAQVIGDSITAMQVLRRGLSELTLDSITTVLELIDTNSIYRGAEHRAALVAFKTLKESYDTTPAEQQELLLWLNVTHHNARFRNTVIGTLVQDLSDGVELEKAVHSFETKVAPTNYKRTKSLITPGMRDGALKTVRELGLEPSLSRRHARVSDVSINDVLWVDNAVRGLMKEGGIAALLQTQVKVKPPNLDSATPISIEDFMSSVLPQTTTLQVLLESRLLGNLMSLTAPCDVSSPRIFKWGNNFGWSYRDNVADSIIKQRVKGAGGNVTAPFRVSLAWFNYDDLDIYVYVPGGGWPICFMNRTVGTGTLDVDANAGRRRSRTPVENVCWTAPINGTYQVHVKNFSKRESIDVGFTLEVESMGIISTYHYDRPVGDRCIVHCLTITVRGGQVTDITAAPNVEGNSSSTTEWGLMTQTLVKVDTVILSPNYWGDNHSGNKHWFFILHECLNPEPTRGIYNEFLRHELESHKKVFEVLGDLTKVPPVPEQLSGLGFSSTRNDKLKVIATGIKANSAVSISTKAYEINFS